MRAVLILACVSVAFAGQSVPLTSGQQGIGIDPNNDTYWQANPARCEIQMPSALRTT